MQFLIESISVMSMEPNHIKEFNDYFWQARLENIRSNRDDKINTIIHHLVCRVCPAGKFSIGLYNNLKNTILFYKDHDGKEKCIYSYLLEVTNALYQNQLKENKKFRNDLGFLINYDVRFSEIGVVNLVK